MKLITFLLLINFTNSQSHETFDTADKASSVFSYSELKRHKINGRKSEKDLLISILLHSKWSDFTSVLKMSTHELKALLITELSKRTNETTSVLQSKTNLELSSFCLAYTF